MPHTVPVRSSLLPPFLLFLFLATLAGACAARRAPNEGEVVRRIEFEGSGGAFKGASDFDLRSAMEQRESRPIAFGLLYPRKDQVALDRDDLAGDSWRIETWYAHQGWFDAQVTGWEVRTVKKGTDSRRAHVVVVGHVREGEPTLVRSVSFEGLDGTRLNVIRGLIDRQRPLKEGERFRMEDHKETEALILARLRMESFARARVTSHVEVFPDEHAVDVVYMVDAGEPCTFGTVSISGTEHVPADKVRDEVTIEEGTPFDSADVVETQKRLFALGTFSVVDVRPDTSGEETSVPVRIAVEESRFREMKAGGGVAIEPGSQDVHGTLEFKHRNVWGSLWQFRASNALGYKWTATVADLAQGVEGFAETGGATDLALVELTVPRFPGRRMRLENELGFALDLEEETGYRYWNPTFSPSVVWKSTEDLTLSFGYRIEFFRYLEREAAQRAAEEGGAQEYVLSSVEPRATWDARNDPMFTTRGSLLAAGLSVAGGPFLGDYDFVRGTADERFYLPIRSLLGWRPRAAIVPRLGGGAIVSYGTGSSGTGSSGTGERALVPPHERLYLGGSGDVRGWAYHHLGPADCDATDKHKNCVEVTPTGGTAEVHGGVEVRGYWLNGVGVAGFVDSGMVWSELSEVALSQVQPSAGGGLRYRSVVGPIRLDVEFRLRDSRIEFFEDEPRWGIHLGLGEAY